MPFENVPEAVRRRMARVRKSGSKPEVLVRSLAHRLGYRFRNNRRDLPGTPDVVFPGRRKIIFVHGCFWHRHEGCALAGAAPRTRAEYWHPKLARNVERDRANEAALHAAGWRTLTIWECETRDRPAVESKITGFLGAD